jgi:competence CoiA-like predicted nuclease
MGHWHHGRYEFSQPAATSLHASMFGIDNWHAQQVLNVVRRLTEAWQAPSWLADLQLHALQPSALIHRCMQCHVYLQCHMEIVFSLSFYSTAQLQYMYRQECTPAATGCSLARPFEQWQRRIMSCKIKIRKLIMGRPQRSRHVRMSYVCTHTTWCVDNSVVLNTHKGVGKPHTPPHLPLSR